VKQKRGGEGERSFEKQSLGVPLNKVVKGAFFGVPAPLRRLPWKRGSNEELFPQIQKKEEIGEKLVK